MTRQNLVEEHTLAEKARIEREIFESQRCLAGSIVMFLRAHHCCFWIVGCWTSNWVYILYMFCSIWFLWLAVICHVESWHFDLFFVMCGSCVVNLWLCHKRFKASQWKGRRNEATSRRNAGPGRCEGGVHMLFQKLRSWGKGWPFLCGSGVGSGGQFWCQRKSFGDASLGTSIDSRRKTKALILSSHCHHVSSLWVKPENILHTCRTDSPRLRWIWIEQLNWIKSESILTGYRLDTLDYLIVHEGAWSLHLARIIWPPRSRSRAGGCAVVRATGW